MKSIEVRTAPPARTETPGIDDNELNWMADGACRGLDPELFFPEDGLGVEGAKQICRACNVSKVCLEYALDNREDHGVWGGTSERERRRILKRRRHE